MFSENQTKWLVRQPVFDGLRAGRTAQQICSAVKQRIASWIGGDGIPHLQELARWLRSDTDHAGDIPVATRNELLGMIDREIAILQNPHMVLGELLGRG